MVVDTTKIDYKKIINECECLKIRKKSRHITKLYNDCFKELKINITQIHCMVMMIQFEGKNMNYISKELGMDRTTLSRNLVTLEKRGIVHKVSGGKKGRQTIYSVTDNGKELIEKIIPLWVRAQKSISFNLDKEEREIEDSIDEYKSVYNLEEEQKKATIAAENYLRKSDKR
jgi:DNA-binding MarR family transcriptional regulator